MPAQPRREAGRGPPAGSHEAPLRKTLVFLVFLRRRLWNSAGGHGPHDANLMLIVKTLCLMPNPYKIYEFEGFHGMVPAYCHAVAERTTARTVGAQAACQMRHMGMIEKP